MVKDGYKQTDIGVIPEDWEEKKLDDIAIVKGGKRLPKGKFLQSSKTNHPYIRVKDMSFGGIDLNDIQYVPDDVFPTIKNYTISKNDLFISVAGTLGIVGRIPYVLDGASLTENANKLTNIKCNIDFLYYMLASPLVQNYIESSKTTGAQPKLALTRIESFKISVPSDEQEQKAIVTVLSGTDELINSLEKLISKKEAIKTATMQQLLTGKKRLDGFSGEWEEKKLEDIVIHGGLVRGPFGGSLKKEHFVKHGYKVYEQKNAINANIEIGQYFINQDKYNELKRFEVEEDDFIVSCSGTIGRIYQIPENSPKGIINQALLKIRVDTNKIDSYYFLIIFKWEKFQAEIIDSTQGGAMKNLVGMDIFKNIPIQVPSLKEQKAIATILSDMDKELESIKAKLSKIKAIKEGMMQELLTGKTRLMLQVK